ncbi:nucleoside hydrolase-like domain-containing protein [uncultured Paracoccus sp.]|uniref:nucleoside hydrolase-like domain-containing protein n=1 Tax=uncultured Paracoccus sp. TaxID=189685 RepID=UPI0026230751|nr:nucleoside hydrolase-like domain-containing protein [uncultured Paracoccus sp.]
MPLPRVFISTDLRLTSEEKDDAQSLVHALLYQDKMNIVGIAGTASKHGHQNGRVGDIDRIIDVYARDHAKLEAHSSAFKSADELKAVSWQGASETAPWQGYSSPTESSRAIITEAREAAAAGEKLNVLTWGGETDLAQALHDDPSIAAHVRFFNISSQDTDAYDYIKKNFQGELDLWVDNQSTFRGMYQTPTSSSIIKGWHEENAKGHGALGDLFAELSGDIFNQAGVKMGDSPTVLRFLSGDQDNPTRESWGGEFIKVSDGYYTDNPHPDLDLGGRSNTKGAMTIYEDRAAWMKDFAGRLDWLDGDAAGKPPAERVEPAEPDTSEDRTPASPAPAPAPAPVPAPVPVSSGDNILVNGSFEGSPVASGQFASFGSVQGWTAIPGGRIEIWNDHRGVGATDGDDYLELDHEAARDGFHQDVAAATGQAYTLSFDLRARPEKSLSTQDIEVVWNDKVVATAKPGADWGTFTTSVTGAAGTDRLMIREVGSQSGDGYGALLDDFVLVPTGAAPTRTPAPAPAPTGETGEDVVVVKASGDAYKGDPAFALTVNGKTVSASTVVAADRGDGEWDSFVFRGDFDVDGSDRVGITFLNDRYEGRGNDRNLYIDEVVLNGEVNGADESFYRNGTAEWDF